MQGNIWHENKRKKNIKFFNEIAYISKENGVLYQPSLMVLVQLFLL